jgi:hypothetical protein
LEKSQNFPTEFAASRSELIATSKKFSAPNGSKNELAIETVQGCQISS